MDQEIQGDRVRLILQEGTRVIPTKEAMALARSAGLHLVLIATPAGGEPVCKIADPGKLRYEMEKGQKREKPHRMKEITLHPNIADHDLETKNRHAREFLQHGDRVLFRLVFRGREKAHKDIGIALLRRITTALAEDGKAEEPQSSGGCAFLRINPCRPQPKPEERNGAKAKKAEAAEAPTESEIVPERGLPRVMAN